MPSEQSRLFIVPAADLALVTSTIHQSFPTALIGTKPHEEGSLVLAVTLFSDRPEGLEQLLSALGADSLNVPPVAPPKSLSDLVNEIQRLQPPSASADPTNPS